MRSRVLTEHVGSTRSENYLWRGVSTPSVGSLLVLVLLGCGGISLVVIGSPRFRFVLSCCCFVPL